MRYILLAVFFLVSPVFANAYTYDRTPSGNGAYDSVEISVTTSDISEFCSDMFETPEQWAISIFTAGDMANDIFTAVSPFQSASNLSLTHTFTTLQSEDIVRVAIACEFQSFTHKQMTIIEGEYPNPTLFTLNAYTSPAILGGTYSFIDFADITPSDMIASVKDGTQQTTGKTLPLIVLVGIPLAFLILLALVNFLQQTVKEDTRKRGKKAQDDFKKLFKEEKKEDFIYHSAEDLEFKREYGNRKKAGTYTMKELEEKREKVLKMGDGVIRNYNIAGMSEEQFDKKMLAENPNLEKIYGLNDKEFEFVSTGKKT